MNPVDVHLRIFPGFIRLALPVLLLGVLAAELASENVTLTTYYPAPSGIYTQMITTGNTALARDAGSLAVGAANNSLGPGVKMAVIGGDVGIGTTSPHTPSPNHKSGNLDANDVYFRSTGKWASQGTTSLAGAYLGSKTIYSPNAQSYGKCGLGEIFIFITQANSNNSGADCSVANQGTANVYVADWNCYCSFSCFR